IINKTAEDPAWWSVAKVETQAERIVRMYKGVAAVPDDGGKRAETIQNALDLALHPGTKDDEALAAIRGATRAANGDRVMVALNTEPFRNQYVLIGRFKEQAW